MSFPFDITYKKRLSNKAGNFVIDDILETIKLDFIKSGADTVRMEGNHVIAKNRMFRIRIRPGLNFNRWLGISSADLLINDSEKFREVIYTFNTTRIFLVGVLFGFFFGLISPVYWMGIIVFGVMGLLNWLFKLLQHWAYFEITLMNFIKKSDN